MIFISEHFDSSDDAKEFVKAKVVSLIATHTEVINAELSGKEMIIMFLKYKVFNNFASILTITEATINVTCFVGDNESAKFQSACSRFKRLFAMPEEEKLVNCKIIL